MQADIADALIVPDQPPGITAVSGPVQTAVMGGTETDGLAEEDKTRQVGWRASAPGRRGALQYEGVGDGRAGCVVSVGV